VSYGFYHVPWGGFKGSHTLARSPFFLEVTWYHYCTKTAASGLVEYTKANERILLKELGKLAL